VKPIVIRAPLPGEVPLSDTEKQVAEEQRIHPTRRYEKRFAWREPVPPAPKRRRLTLFEVPA
jgi:hypothetical protein